MKTIVTNVSKRFKGLKPVVKLVMFKKVAIFAAVSLICILSFGLLTSEKPAKVLAEKTGKSSLSTKSFSTTFKSSKPHNDAPLWPLAANSNSVKKGSATTLLVPTVSNRNGNPTSGSANNANQVVSYNVAQIIPNTIPSTRRNYPSNYGNWNPGNGGGYQDPNGNSPNWDPGNGNGGGGWGGGGGGGSSTSNWTDISISADEKCLTAIDKDGRISVSNDSGVTWTPSESARSWSANTMLFSDGSYQVATVDGGYIYMSSDYGATWTPTGSAQSWSAVSFASGILVATTAGGYIYTSSDYGSTWTPTSGTRNWSGIGLSNPFWVATVAGGYIYMSSDRGVTWTPTAIDNVRNWSGIDLSHSSWVATVAGGYIYMSTDSGGTWIPKVNQGVRDWSDISVSGDGTYLTATVAGGYLYTSADGGNSWKPTDSSRNWSSVKVSFSGQYQAATVSGGAVYLSTDYGATWNQKIISSNSKWSDTTGLPRPVAPPFGLPVDNSSPPIIHGGSSGGGSNVGVTLP